MVQLSADLKQPSLIPPKTTLKTDLEERILHLISDNPAITREQLAENLNVSINTIKEYILRLRKKELLERVSGRRSGSWRVNDE